MSPNRPNPHRFDTFAPLSYKTSTSVSQLALPNHPIQKKRARKRAPHWGVIEGSSSHSRTWVVELIRARRECSKRPRAPLPAHQAFLRPPRSRNWFTFLNSDLAQIPPCKSPRIHNILSETLQFLIAIYGYLAASSTSPLDPRVTPRQLCRLGCLEPNL